jgi:hypothetical protein
MRRKEPYDNQDENWPEVIIGHFFKKKPIFFGLQGENRLISGREVG